MDVNVAVNQNSRRSDRLTPGFALNPMASRSQFDAQTEAICHCEIGTLMLGAAQHQEALEQFERALTLQPHAVEAWGGRAEALACLDRYEEALSSLEQAQELADYSHTRIWVQKAVVLILLQRYEEALSCCALVLKRQPDHVQALLFQGVALHCLGQYHQACRSYHRVTTLTNPRSSHPAKGADREPQSHRSLS